MARTKLSDAKPSYSDHFETIVALIVYLGLHTQHYEDNTIRDSASVKELAHHLDLEEQEIRLVLNTCRGLFRRTQSKHVTPGYGKDYRYSLMLRYARREYAAGGIKSEPLPLTNDDLFSLLEFVTNKVKEEQETQRVATTNRITMIGVWAAAILSLVSLLATLLKP